MTKISGDVHKDTSLYEYLKDRRLWKATHISKKPDLHVAKLAGSNNVYLVDDGHSHKKFILKSFQTMDVSLSKALHRTDREFSRLKKADHIIGRRDWVRVVVPYCKSDHGHFFAEQYVTGTPLGKYIKRTMESKGTDSLYEKLTMLAGFFSILHKKTLGSDHVNSSNIRDELKRHAQEASEGGAMTHEELKETDRLIHEACSYDLIKDAKKAFVHGDANPSNFLYGNGRLYVIDMERAGYRDPVYDLGILAGELFHYAMYYGRDPYKADPFIGHLYWTYAGNFKDQRGTFIRLTKRNPLYMANSLLRIARHPYFSMDYKRRLAYHAKECLKSLKKLQ